ncbi:HEAT repeat domain-containing protein [Sorangium sp. So ce1097]|uniref:HEAT repeat domain-containing protein n=1 Tax=Sorangium sp. So ce1097 TaxID=3133330 RepID=UPI003F63B357
MEMAQQHGAHVVPELADQEQQYRRFLIEQFERLTFKGISRSGKAISLPLEEIYVELKAVADVPDAADTYSADERRLLLEAEVRGLPDGDLRRELDSLRVERWREESRRGHGRMVRRSIDEAIADPSRPGLVILGDPGCGKTTLLHYLALRAAREGLPERGGAAARPGADLRTAKGQPRIPIFVPLAAYDDWLRRDYEPLSLNDFLPVYYDTWCCRPGLGPLFRQALDDGRALVLLDGLDEVLDVTTRRHIASQARALIQGEAARGNRFVVTSRIVGYREAQLPGDLPHVTVLDFGERDIQAFAQRWCEACEAWLAGGQATGLTHKRAAQEAKELLAEVRANPSVLRLAANPLLLTLLALLRRQGGRLPDERVRLYERYIDMLLDSNWESARSDGARTREPERFDRKLATTYLVDVALWLQRHKPSGTARRRDLEGALVEIALRADGIEPLKASPRDRQQAHDRAALFFKDMRHFAGLLAERGQDAFGFLHLTFQEYFVGRALARMEPKERWALLNENLHRPRWREPILLCAGQLGIVEGRSKAVCDLGRRILGARSPHEELLHRDVLLVSAIAADGVGFDRALLDELASKLMELAYNVVPAVRIKSIKGLAKLARSHHEGAFSWLKDRIRRKRRPRETARALEGELRAESLGDLRRALGEWIDGTDYAASRCAVESLKTVASSDEAIRSLMLEKLNTEDSELRSMLVSALGALASTDGEVRDILLRELDAPSARARRSAITALGELVASDQVVRSFLLARLDDPQHEVREEAISTLGPLAATHDEIRRCIIAKLDDADRWVRKSAARALAVFAPNDEEVRRIAVAMADDPHREVREENMSALSALAPIDRKARGILLARLDDTDAWLREAAVRALGGLVSSDEEVGSRIRSKFDDAHHKVRLAVLDAVRSTPSSDVEARRLALRGLRHEEWPMRHEVLPEMIGALKGLAPADGELRQRLLHRLDDESWIVRKEIVSALEASVSRDARVHDFVLDKLDDPDSTVRAAAVQAMSTVIQSDIEVRRLVLRKLDDDDRGVRLRTIGALEPLVPTDAEVRRLILDRLDHADTIVLHAAARTLRALAFQDLDVRRVLLRIMRDPDPFVREAAVRALEPLATVDTEIRRMILKKLDDPGQLVRAAAVHALGPLAANDEVVRQEIIARLYISSNVERWAGTSTLATILAMSEKARQLIISRLDAPVELTRAAAVRALGALAPSDAYVRSLIISRLRDAEASVRIAALHALSTSLLHDGALHDIVLERLDDESFHVRCSAADALAPLITTDPPVRRRLIRWLGLANDFGDADVEHTRRRLADAYGSVIAHESGLLAQLVSMLRSPAWPERKGAAWAIIAMPGGPPPEVLPALRALLDDTRAEESWPARLMAAGMLINDRDAGVSQAAIAKTLTALEYATKPWYNLSRNGGHIRAQAAAVLGTLQPMYWNDAVFERLTRVLHEDADANVRDAAYEAVLRLAVSPEPGGDVEAMLTSSSAPEAQPLSPHRSNTTMPPLPPSTVLHLSDLHFGTRESAAAWHSQLAEDLQGELGCSRLDAIILSGDIANQSTPEEYDAARRFLEKLCDEFQLSPQQVIPVPGNHDLHWGLAKKAYKLFDRDDYTGKLEDGRFIDIGSGAIRVRDEGLYAKRFEHFARFYEDVRGEPYPLDPAQQGLVYRLPAQRLLVLGLNSAWNLDHHFRARAAIHPEALSRALDQLRGDPATRDWLRIAVWHHPVNSAFEDRIKDHGFLERLAGAGFRLGLHGHIHKAQNGLYRYDVSAAGRRIELVCAGTFGAPTHEWVPGYPLQYQLLRFEGDTLTVETRRREEINGTWKPDARWTAERGKDPAPRYQVVL